MRFEAIIFDFDGVLIDSEYAGNRHLAECLTGLGHPTSPAEAMAAFMGLSGDRFLAAVESYLGAPIPPAFHVARSEEAARALREGLAEVAGARAFVQALPADFPRAIASSSSTEWIHAHLNHLGLAGDFGDHVYSSRQHVARGKPAPDLYLHAAAQLGVAIERSLIVEDSPVGATGAVASGAHVIGLCAGSHCSTEHAGRLRALGVHDIAMDFCEVARLAGLR
jgi:HAD superfamily hydrolase (TIGR01509 family)